MSKKACQVIFFAVCMLISMDVYAECTTKELNKLKQEAYNIKLNYEYIEGSFGESDFAYFTVTAANLSESIKLKYGSFDYTYDKSNEIPSEGSINGIFRDDSTYSFNVYASSNTSCDGTLLTTKKIKIPNFNEYSTRSECVGFSEYDYCQRWYSGKIESEEEFLAKIEEYKNGNMKPSDREQAKGIFNKIVDWIVNNLAIVIPTAILIIGTVSYIVVDYMVRKKKRVRIKI